MNYTFEDLKNRFPKYMQQVEYIECGEGWADLIYEAFSFAERMENEIEVKTYFSQIKEKFGLLRIYYSYTGEEDVFSDKMEEVEEKSGNICEYCGSTQGEMSYFGGWTKCLCQDCKNRLEDGYL